MTPEQIARKYVLGSHDALTNEQEVKDMEKDIESYSEVKNRELHELTKELLGKYNEAIYMDEYYQLSHLSKTLDKLSEIVSCK